MSPRRIAVLMHERGGRSLGPYLLSALAEHWRNDGHHIELLFGTGRFVPADILFVHVDRSVVPERYLSFARRYPVTVNAGIRDIRKSTLTRGLLGPGDRWDGPVIVKTDANYAGLPERRGDGIPSRLRRALRRVAKGLGLDAMIPTPDGPLDYRIYDHLGHVPRLCFRHPGLVVQKFVPEREGESYCVRAMVFLGDHLRCVRMKGEHPILKAENATSITGGLEPHPRMMALRRQLGFDYGKFDYVLVDGEPFLLDANKTVGHPGEPEADLGLKKRLRFYSQGLYDLLDG